MISTPFGEITAYQLQATAVAVGLFVLTFVVSLVAIGWLLVRLPSTYFLDGHRREFWTGGHPAARWVGLALKNLLGLSLVVLGVFLSLPGVPGQGLLTILVGIILLDIPGKRRIERALVARPAIRRNVDRLRARYGRPPLELEDKADQPT